VDKRTRTGTDPGPEYGIDFDQWLETFVFFKQVYSGDHVDNAVTRFIEAVLKTKKLSKIPVVLWRGEYTNSLGQSMWVLGVSARGEQIIYDCLLEAVRESGYSDYGAYQRIDTGCTPYLLLLDKSIWKFEPSKTYGESGSLQLGDEEFAVRFTRCVHEPSKKTEGREGEELHPFHHELSDLLDEWRSTFTDSASQNWALVFPQFPDLLYWNVGEIEYHHLAAICRDILKLPILELPMEGHGRTIVRPRWAETEESFQGHRIKMGVFHKIKKSRHSD